jgi:hypothetical protein
MRIRYMAGALALALCTGLGSAQQMSCMKTDTHGGAMLSPAKSADELLTVFESEIVGVAEAMPADRYNFSPAAGTFASGSSAKFAGVRTFAQEISHVTEANYYFFSMIDGVKPDVDRKSLESMTDKQQLIAALKASFEFGRRAMATITPQNAFERIDGVDGIHTRIGVAFFASAHGYDHYGQMVEYLRMNGVLPPGSK